MPAAFGSREGSPAARMDSVRARIFGHERVLNRVVRPSGARIRHPPAGNSRTELIVLDVVFAFGVIALFALIGLLAKAVDRL